MILPLLVVVIGFAALMSGVYEENLATMIIGAVLMLAGWGTFRWRWYKQKKKNNKEL